MKKILVLFMFIPILLVSVSAISTNLNPVYQPGETIIIEIQGNILEPIQKSDVIFRRAHVAVAVDYDIKRIADKYYLYAQAPLNLNNYTLFINNIATTVNGQNQRVDFNQSFTVEGNLTDYSISPGFIIANQDFELTVKSNLDLAQTININFPSERAVTINPGINEVQFPISSVESGVYMANIGKYLVPIQIIKSSQVLTQNISLEMSPLIIRETLELNKPKSYSITVANTGQNLSNLYFIYNSDTFLVEPQTFSLLENNSSIIQVSLVQTNQSIIDSIFIAHENEILGNVTFSLYFTANQSEITNSSLPAYYCQELGGKFCAASEVCSTSPVQALDGSCCTGLCVAQEESSNSWIFYTFIAIVLLIVAIIYFKYKKTSIPKPKNPPITSVIKKPINPIK